jgi:SAM-dependent methyltransferase
LIPLRYFAGYGLVFLSRLSRKVLTRMWRVASLPEEFALIVWTPREIDRYLRAGWNSWPVVRDYANADDWFPRELALVESYFTNNGELLNLACGAGREALLLARRGLRVTACGLEPSDDR